MYQYFQHLKEVASLDKENYKIKDLTIKIMEDAGYHLAEKQFKNGNKKYVTAYTKPFNNILVAKWLLFYEKLFVAKLYSHPEFKEHQIDVINNTFFITMQCLKKDKILDDNTVNRYVNLAILSKINDVLWKIGSTKRINEYNSENKILKLRLKDYLSYRAESYDAILEGNPNFINEQVDLNVYDELILELKLKLNDNPLGEAVLNSFIYSEKQIDLKRIDKYVLIDNDEYTPKNKLFILDAYNKIKETLCQLKNVEFVPEQNIKYSFEKKSV